jgi:C4-dicarboxylate transporter DctQ subunit
MKKAIDIFNKFQDYSVAALTATFITVILIGTFCRYTQITALRWPDELSRFLMVWMTFIGAGAAARAGSHFAINMVYAFVPRRIHKVFLILSLAIIDVSLIYILYLSINTIRVMVFMRQVSPAMGIPMWLMYLAVPIGCFLVLVQGTGRAVTLIKEGGMASLEEVAEEELKQ